MLSTYNDIKSKKQYFFSNKYWCATFDMYESEFCQILINEIEDVMNSEL